MKRKKTGAEPKKVRDLDNKGDKSLKYDAADRAGMSADEIRQLIHELEVHKVELEMQNEELRKAQVKLEESRARYTDLYDFAPICYLTFDSLGVVLEANLTVAAELGTEKGRLVGSPFQAFLDADDRMTFYFHLRRVCHRHERATCELKLIRKNKSEFHAHLESVPARDSAGMHVCRTSFVDISAKKNTELELQDYLKKSVSYRKVETALLQTARLILKSRNFEQSARAIYDSCKQLTGATSGYVALLSADGQANEILFLDTGSLSCSVDPNLPMPVRGLRAETYRTGKTIYDNAFSDSKWTKYLPEGHSRLDNVLFAPLLIDEKAVGLFGLANKPNGFTEVDVQIVTAFSQLAAVSLLNAGNIQALEESEKRYRSVVQTASDPIITITSQGKITFWNKAAETCFGYRADEVVGRNCQSIIPEEYREPHQEALSLAVSTRGEKLIGRPLEMKGQRKDGSTFPLELTLAKWEKGDAIFFTGIIRDITERKRALEELKTSEQRFKELFRHMRGGGAIYRAVNDGRDFLFVDYHGPADQTVDTELNEKVGKSVLDVFPEAGKHGLFNVFQRVWKTGKAEYHPITIYDDNEKIAGWRENYVYKLPSGEIVAIYDDLTERKQMEETLRQNEELFRTIFQTSPNAININRMEDGGFVDINEGFTELSGYTKEDVLGKTGLEIKIWHDLKDREKLFETLRREGRIKNFEAQFCLKDGRLIPGMVSAKVINLNNEPHLLAVTRDITELKKAEHIRKKAQKELEQKVEKRTAELSKSNEELRRQIEERKQIEASLIESEKKYSSLIEASLIGVYISLKGKLELANEQFAEIYGYSRDELIGMNTSQLVHPDDRPLVDKIRTMRLRGEGAPTEYEIRGLKKDGETIWVIKRNTLISYMGKPATLGNVADITERKKMEETLRKSENELRILSTQLLYAEEKERKRIAHELHDGIGQALTAIKFSVENNLRNLSDRQVDFDDKSLRATVPLIQKTIEETRKIIMDLRPSTLDDLGIIATISWFCREYESIYTAIHVDKEIAIDENEIPAPLKTVIYRILQEGFNNAAKHSKTDHISLGLKKIRNEIVLSIKDRGVGFEVDKVLCQQTAKRGVGLASMRERALLSGGYFSIESALGNGTTIHASWPLAGV